MSQGDVRYFMRQHTRELSFIVRRRDESREYKDRTAGKRECIHGPIVHDSEGIWIVLCFRRGGQSLSDAANVALHFRVIDGRPQPG